MVQEVVGRVRNSVSIQPPGKDLPLDEHKVSILTVKLLFGFLFVSKPLIDLLDDVIHLGCKVLLQGHALGDYVAPQSLLFKFKLPSNFLIVSFSFVLCLNKCPSSSDGIHELWLEQIVERVELKALVEELYIDLFGKTHQADSLIPDLSNKGPIFLILGGNKLSQEIFTVGFSYSL